ncbi:hypothetical protein N7497_005556 [Penicillium chrysogenum]|nr:hypothetical protein N7497_005556 [Penicillium chrysogenum]
MANSQSTSTSISLADLNTTLEERPARTSNQNGLSTTPSETDIMQQSLLADSQVPDGGEGWVVILGCAVVTWWFIGTSYCWGILQAALVKEGVSTSSTLAFVGSLATACISFLGILNARIIRKLGTRRSALAGVLFLGLGEVLSGFSAMNIGGLFATAGIVMGVGVSLCFMVVSVTPAQYFRAKRGIANGIVYAAGGLGGAVISFVMNALLERVGVQWTFRIIGFATWATGLPAAYLIKQRVPIPPSAVVDWRLFRDVRFVLLFAMGAIATFPLLVPPFFLPLFTASLGMSSATGAGIVAAFNFSSALGRLLCGLCSDIVGPLNTLFISLLLSALSMLIIWPISTSLGPLIVFVIVNGWAGGYLLGAPIAGFILDAAGGENKGILGYRPAIVYAGAMALVASVIGLSIRLKTDKQLLKKL